MRPTASGPSAPTADASSLPAVQNRALRRERAVLGLQVFSTIRPDTGVLTGGRGASLSHRRTRRWLHAHRARRARTRRADAAHRFSFGRPDPDAFEQVALDPPVWAGYVREFVPAVPEHHALHAGLVLLLERGLQRIAYDHIRAFSNPSVPGRRRRKKGSVPVQRLRTLSRTDFERIPTDLRALFDPVYRLHGVGAHTYGTVTYRFRHPDLYRLRVRQLWLTHEAVPTEAARQQQSARDRYWFKAPYYTDLSFEHSRTWSGKRLVEAVETRRRARQARRDIVRDLGSLPDGMTRTTRIRL